MAREGFDAGKAVAMRVQRAKETPEFKTMHAAAVKAATEAYRLGTEHLKAVGGITKVIMAAAEAHGGEFKHMFGHKAKLATLIDVAKVRLEAIKERR